MSIWMNLSKLWGRRYALVADGHGGWAVHRVYFMGGAPYILTVEVQPASTGDYYLERKRYHPLPSGQYRPL